MRRKAGFLLSALLCFFMLASAVCARAEGPEKGYTSASELNGCRIGVQTGTTFDAIVRKALPEAQISYFNSYSDMAAALEAHKIDAFPGDEPVLRLMVAENSRLTIAEGRLESFDFGFVLAKTAKGEALRDEISEWIGKLRAAGELERIIAKWTEGTEQEKTVPDYAAFPATKGTLKLATEGGYAPMDYFRGGEPVGLEIDLAAQFCAEKGYGLTVEAMNFDGILPAIQSGKADFGAAGITITDERKESVLFTDPYYSGGTVLAVLKTESYSAAGGPLDAVAESFRKTFLREDRWRLFLEGVRNTLTITLLSILSGTILGFCAYLLCRNGNRAANGAARFSMWLVQGMPMIVLLMILYYIVFGNLSISGITVAVIGFTLTFGASVFSLLKMGVGAVDNGQYEAAYAMGYSGRRTFFRIILPQALPHVLPAYKGEIVSLIKATAIVGYIAVQDLTKMSDIVRSRTYEAFFPLIAVTIIYFALEGLVGLLISRIVINLDPKRRRREKILQGCGTGEEDGRKGTTEAETPQQLREEPVIRIEHLRKVYPNIIPLQDVNAEIRDGDVISVIGPSGTGKSTLLRCINLLEKPTAGRIWVDGTEITDPKCDINRVRQKMGMVFQSFNLFGHMTVIENIMRPPMELLGRARQEAYSNGMRLLRMVGLAEKALNYPDELSGGQKQRIAIARTLAMDPDIILLDEPTSALDPTMVGEVQAVIRELAKTGKTMMIVTHEMAFARAICNRVFYMDEGGLYEEGTPEEIFDHPRRENTRRFVNRLKVLTLEIANRDYDYPGMTGEISRYCSKNQISRKTEGHIQLAFEELIQQLLLPAVDDPKARVTIEYSQENEQAEMTVEYNGPWQDITRQGDRISLSVLKGTVSEIRFGTGNTEDMPNRLSLKIRE